MALFGLVLMMPGIDRLDLDNADGTDLAGSGSGGGRVWNALGWPAGNDLAGGREND